MNSQPATDRQSFTLRERSPHVCCLAPADVAFLQAAHREHVRVRPTGQRGRYSITPTGHVGTIVCPGARLIIRPKIALTDLFHLLDPSAAVVCTHDESMPEPGTEAFNFLAARFVHVLGEQIQTGLHRGYAERRECGMFLQGRLDVAAHVRAGSRKDRLPCTYEDFAVDVPMNRVNKAVALLMLRSPLLHVRLATRIRPLLRALEGVASVPLTGASFTISSPDRMPDAYRQLITLGRLLFEGLAAGTQTGGVACPAFLLNMEQVFERYVSTGVSAAFAGRPRYAVAVQSLHTAAPPSAEQPDLQIRPDLLLSRDGVPFAVVDAKWKRLAPGALRPDDVYQVLAYAASLGLPHAVLVYPGAHTRRWLYPLTRAPLQLQIYTLRVSGPSAACEQARQRFGRALRASFQT